MKKKIIVSVVSALVLLPLVVGAASIWSQERFVLNASQSVVGNLYVVAQKSSIAGLVNGDLVAVGGNIDVSGDVAEDVLMAAGKAQLSGMIDGDLRIVSGESYIASTVAGDIAVVGGKTEFAKGGKVYGDLLALGGHIEINGDVEGRVHVSGGDVMINGLVEGNVEVQGGRLTIGESAVINGNVRFRGPRAPIVAPGAVIEGRTEFVSNNFEHDRFRYFARGMGILATAAGLLISLVLALIFAGCFRKQTKVLTHETLANLWPSVGRGLLVMIGLPIASVIVMITIVGLPVGAFGLLLFGIGHILTMALSGIVFGSWVMKVVFKKSEYQPTTSSVIWGTVALRVITMIPVLGWAVGLIFCAATFGILARTAYRTYWLAR